VIYGTRQKPPGQIAPLKQGENEKCPFSLIESSGKY
jgi:hypothetical protein